MIEAVRVEPLTITTFIPFAKAPIWQLSRTQSVFLKFHSGFVLLFCL
jgi:hypothetical protein